MNERHYKYPKIPQEVKSLIGIRRAKLKRFKRTRDPLFKLEAKLLTERIDHLLKQKINEEFSRTIKNIDRDPGKHRSEYWKLNKFMKNRPKAIPVIVLEEQECWLLTRRRLASSPTTLSSSKKPLT